MNEIAKSGAVVWVDVVAAGRDLMAVMRKSFAAESSSGTEQAVALAEMETVAATLPALKMQVQAGLRPATEMEIGAGLTMLLEAFPNVGKGEAKSFGRYLVEDVVAKNPSIGAFAAALIHVRRTSRFIPSIAEVLEVIDMNESSLRLSLDQIDNFPNAKGRLEAEILERERIHRLKAERANRLQQG